MSTKAKPIARPQGLYALTCAALLLALSLLLPQVFHLVGLQAGQTFLPMHIPVLVAGLFLGVPYGFAVGVMAPVLSALLTGMPLLARLPFMVVELAAYGAAAGFLRHTLGLHWAPSLLLAQLAGRLAYAAALFVAGNWLGLAEGMRVTLALSATLTGLPGIALQWFAVPALTKGMEKGAVYAKRAIAGKRDSAQ